jgi:hypothetical protein
VHTIGLLVGFRLAVSERLGSNQLRPIRAALSSFMESMARLPPGLALLNVSNQYGGSGCRSYCVTMLQPYRFSFIEVVFCVALI